VRLQYDIEEPENDDDHIQDQLNRKSHAEVSSSFLFGKIDIAFKVSKFQ
jgi:hypothetical protein